MCHALLYFSACRAWVAEPDSLARYVALIFAAVGWAGASAPDGIVWLLCPDGRALLAC